MRMNTPYAAVLGLALAALCACAPLGPEKSAALAPALAAAPPATAAPAPKPPAFSEATVLNDLNDLVNDTPPASAAFDSKRAALAPAAQAPDLSAGLHRVLTQVLAFDPPRLRERWEKLQKAQDAAAALYAANPPIDLTVLRGARILRRLGPVLYLVRLPSGESVIFTTNRRYKAGAKLTGIDSMEIQRPKPDRSKGDLVDELQDQPRSFVEVAKQDARRQKNQRAPVLAELRRLDSENEAVERGVATDLIRMDALYRDVNAVIGPKLLPQASRPAPTALIRKVKRMAKSYSREQYYRYALPVTGKPQVDGALQAHLEERKAEVQSLLRSTGIGRGHARANVDRITFTAFTAAPSLLSIRFEEFRDTGGAHPNTGYSTFVFDLRRQARLTLADLFSDKAAALAVLSELATRRMELVLDGSMFPEGLAPTAENFSVFVVDGADVLFTFPPYQVASYAQGPQTLRVPLFHPRLMPLLTPEFKEALGSK